MTREYDGGQPPRMSARDVNDFLLREFPQIFESGFSFAVEETQQRGARIRLPHSDRHLRPGGTISGPAMFALADVGMYACVLATYGPVALAVTTSLTINFLRKPGPRDMIAEARLLKAGTRLAVGDIALYSHGEAEMVAHATSTYAIPA